MINDKKNIIITVILSVCFSLANIFLAGENLLFLERNLHVSQEKLFLLFWLVCIVLYYFLIMRERKSDNYYYAGRERVKISFLIQIAVMFLLSVAGSIQYHFFPPNETDSGMPDNGMHIVLYFILLPQPVLLHLSGCLFRFLIEKILKL